MDDLNWPIEYVIYCRKSSEEKTEKQVQSIPDQIQKCIDYAGKEWLKIKEKPEDFSEFETKQDIIKEDLDQDNQKLYKKTRNLFIIKEEKSGKIPWKRPKWSRLIKLIDQGKIKGLLSYSPDRQARNIVEWGEIINFVDEHKIDLKYTNFHFEDNAAGKMMLGIRFVFSKQYSDKVSEDTKRWMESKFEDGRALGTYKHGYYFLPSGFHQPHPEFFKLRQQAFRMKIDENKSDKLIANRLKKKWYIKQTFNEEGNVVKETEFIGKNMYNIRIDPFYYWMFYRKDDFVNLNDLNTWYEPLISETDHQFLMERHYDNQWPKTRRELKEEYYPVRPLPEDFIKTPDNYSLTFNLPSPKRFRKKLLKLQITNPNATLWDIVNPGQIRYRCANEKSKYKWLEIKYDSVERIIVQTLSKMNLPDEVYEKYRIFMVSRLGERLKKRNAKKRGLELDKNKFEGKLKEHTLRYLWAIKNEKQQKICDDEEYRLTALIDNIQADIDILKEKERNDILECQALFAVIQNASKDFPWLTYVQKRKIVGLLFLNITINDDSSVTMYHKPWLEELFPKWGGWPDSNRRHSESQSDALTSWATAATITGINVLFSSAIARKNLTITARFFYFWKLKFLIHNFSFLIRSPCFIFF